MRRTCAAALVLSVALVIWLALKAYSAWLLP